MDRTLDFLERWIARPVSIVAAFAAILSVLGWAYNRLAGSVHFFEMELPEPSAPFIEIPVLIPEQILTSPFWLSVALLAFAAISFFALTFMERWRSMLADVFAILLPPTFLLGTMALLAPITVRSDETVSGSSPSLALWLTAVAIAATGTVAFGAWFKFASTKRVEYVAGKSIDFFLGIFLFHVRAFGFLMAFTYTALPIILLLVHGSPR